MMNRGVIVNDDHFDRNQVLTATGGHNGWTIADTSAAGTPTYQTINENGGAMKILLDNTSEVQNVCMYQGDVLALNPALLQSIEMECKVAAIGAATTLVFGIGSARNDAVASVACCAWFRILGSGSTSNVLIDTRDGTNSQTSIATGVTLSSTYKKFVIDFTNGLADVRFFIDGARVAGSTIFNMSLISSTQNLQPLIQLQKTSATDVPAFTISRYVQQQRFAYGA